MRLTFDAVRDGLDAIRAATDEMARAQWQVSSGRRLRVPSDDPAAMRRVIATHAELGGLDAYARTADSTSARLLALDSYLGDIVDRLTQALSTAQGARGSTADQASRDTAAATLLAVRDAVASDINATYQGTHLFSGSRSETAAWASVGGTWTYQGDATDVSVDVDTNRAVRIALDGGTLLQGSDATDALTVLDTLAAAVTAGDDAAIGTGMEALQRAFDRATRAQAQVGFDGQLVAEERERLTARRLAAATRLSQEQDVDLADAVTRMTQAQAAYQAALAAVSTTHQRSLFDYLK